jgi:hypothetical protein
MIFFENTFRLWKVRLEPIADRKPLQLKEACKIGTPIAR